MTPAQFSKAMDLLNHQQNKFGLNPRTISRMKINMPIRDSLKAEIIRALESRENAIGDLLDDMEGKT
tara:strand:+ start:1355 stop:1555 length:201 start_codon:yes stop_codon:yes gene_type:complete